MAYDEKLAERARQALKGKQGVTEKKMFRGLCFLLNGNMALGVEKDRLIVRSGPEKCESVLKRKHARPIDSTGRPLKGFMYVDPDGVRTKHSLEKWVGAGIAFAETLNEKMTP